MSTNLICGKSRTSRSALSQSTYNVFDGAAPLHSVRHFSHSRQSTAVARKPPCHPPPSDSTTTVRARWQRHTEERTAAAAGTINADVSTASNSGSLAQMSVALHQQPGAHYIQCCTCTPRRIHSSYTIITCIAKNHIFSSIVRSPSNEDMPKTFQS